MAAASTTRGRRVFRDLFVRGQSTDLTSIPGRALSEDAEIEDGAATTAIRQRRAPLRPTRADLVNICRERPLRF